MAKSFETDCQEIPRFVAILVHGYSTIDDLVVYSNIRGGENDIYRFIDEVNDCLDTT